MNKKLLYLLVFVVLAVVTCFLQPHDDDWQYLFYFDNPQVWGLSKETYVWDCILLPGTYWRPLSSMFNWAEAHWAPMSMPYANHIFISFGMVGIAYMTRKLMLLLGIKDSIATISSLLLILATTSMGALLSIDSFQNVYATFFGVLSALAFQSQKKTKWLWWFIAGWLAAWGKETGFVWFMAGPIIEEVLRQKNSLGQFKFSQIEYKKFVPKTIVCLLPIVLYLGLYISLNPSRFESVGVSSGSETEVSVNVKDSDKGMLTTMTAMEKNDSYKLTPSTFVKNIGVLYVFGIFPIDTSAIYFKLYALLGITVILALIWIILLWRPMKKYIKEHGQEFLLLLLLMIWISGPSLVTRAGEISPIIHMTIMAVILALVFNDVQITKWIKIGIVCFVVATLITDVHKYIIAYKAGDITREIAQKVVAETDGKPEKVLMIQVDDFSNKKSGAFMINPADGIRKGSAMIREYHYEYPKMLSYQTIPVMEEALMKQTVDSIVASANGVYDCVWFCHDVNSKVYNLKK